MSLIIDNSHPYKHFRRDEISIRRDDIFKIVFGSNDNVVFLKSFLEAILNTKIIDIEIKNEVSLDREVPQNKLVKVDILAEIYKKDEKKEIIDIEIQNYNEYNIIKRGEFHASKIFYNSLKKGQDYNLAKKTVVIWITDFEQFKDGPYHEFSKIIRNSNGEVLSEDITYHFIQLPKFYKQVTEIVTLEEQWLAYLSCQLNKEELEGLFNMNKDIRDVNKMAEEILKDEELMDAIDAKVDEQIEENLRLEHAYNNGKEQGKEEGIEQGIEQGEKQKSMKIAKNLLAKGIDINTIIETTGLTKEEIEEL